MTGSKNLRLSVETGNFRNNYKISSVYQAIRDIDKQGIKFGEPPGIRALNLFLKRELLYQLS
jgi:hypothetical protein